MQGVKIQVRKEDLAAAEDALAASREAGKLLDADSEED